MWSKESDAIVNNDLAYYMTQMSSLKILDLQPFTQDSQVQTKVKLN